ncbi:MAG: beta-propeller fold lactonase family protein [Verrucomicrobiales bacterium]|nr:beta-propeller fold lactonase family protein [Verrucomicrobiales bacterium]
MRPLPLLTFLFSLATIAHADFVNFETPHVHPLDLSPDRTTLAACNTADNRIELFTLSNNSPPAPAASIPVGLDPVSARFRTGTELWVVNQLSDTISVVDLPTRTVLRTLHTDDEPADVVFAGTPQKAFVTCSATDTVLVFNTADLTATPTTIAIEGEDPRALAASADGSQVYAAIFESGNRTTVLGGGADDSGTVDFPPNVVSDPTGPYQGTNPPPNNGNAFEPSKNPENGTPPAVGLIVRQDDTGAWRDDNGSDWTALVSGSQAAKSGRPVGWTLIDNDVAIIDTTTLTVTYATGLMNANMAIAVNPDTGAVTTVGTDATNEIRFEPVVNGTFIRTLGATFNPSLTGPEGTTANLNPHLDYTTHTIPQESRDLSLGDPRGIVWNPAGTTAYVTGMGSNNVAVFDPTGTRLTSSPIEVGEGPTGIQLDAPRNSLYVLNRFDASLSVVDTSNNSESSRIHFHDPTPPSIKIGRKHLYDTHKNSGLGQSSCASCHIDSRTDRLGWDLGDPKGEIVPVTGETHNLGGNVPGLNTDFTDFHPMKGPMTTQTMQDIIGHEPHHWRGDRFGIEEFNHAFIGLLGDDTMLTTKEMQEFEDYLATICFPPNPFRNLDNSLPTNLPLPGPFRSGRFGREGRPMPAGNAQRALDSIYIPFSRAIDRQAFACVTCHTLPTGAGTNAAATSLSLVPFSIGFEQIPTGPLGEKHHALVSVDGSTQRNIKIPQLRNLYDKVGFEMTQTTSRAGFGYLHDGSIDSLTRFLSEPAFDVRSDQEVADLVALMLAFSGSGYGDLPESEPIQVQGTPSKDAHAAVGTQLTLTSSSATATLNMLLSLADSEAVDLVAKATVDSTPRGWLYTGAGIFSADQLDIAEPTASLLTRATTSTPVTFTAVPAGSGLRIGIERDRDGLLDYDETRDLVPSVAGVQNPFDPASNDSTGNDGSLSPDGIPDGENDFDNDGESNAAELAAGTNPVDNLVTAPDLDLSIAWNNNQTAIVLTFTTEPQATYQVLYSDDLVTWTPSPTGTLNAPGTSLTWTDPGQPATPSPPAETTRRYYTVSRTE